MKFVEGNPRHVRGVRYRDDTGFEMRCADCRTYWPLDVEFWKVYATLQRCRACEDKRNRSERMKAYYRNREVELARTREYDKRTITYRYRECPKCGNQIESRRITRAYCNACYAEYERERRARKETAA